MTDGAEQTDSNGQDTGEGRIDVLTVSYTHLTLPTILRV